MESQPVSASVKTLLSADECRALEALVEIAHGSPHVVPSVLGTGLDDFDDWQALLGIGALTRLGLAQPRLLVTGLQGSAWRARVTKGTLSALGMPSVPVAAGSDRIQRPAAEIRALSLVDPTFMATEYAVINDRMGAMREAFDTPVNMIGLASFSDFSDFIRARDIPTSPHGTFLMSGAQQQNEAIDTRYDQLELDSKGHMQPNSVATNNRFDPSAASDLFKFAQQGQGRLTVVTRQASYASTVSMGVVKSLEVYGTHDPISKFIYDLSVKLLQQLWEGVVDGKIRDLSWFYDTFTDGEIPEKLRGLNPLQMKFTRMVDVVHHFVPYDLLTVLAAVPILKDELFRPVVSPDGQQAIIGLSKAQNGINPHSSIDLTALIGLLTKLPLLEKLEREGRV